MVLVWTRSRFSLGGTRCQRWPSASSRNRGSARAPPRSLTRRTQRPSRASATSRLKTVVKRAARVDAQLLVDQGLGVLAPFGTNRLRGAAARLSTSLRPTRRHQPDLEIEAQRE